MTSSFTRATDWLLHRHLSNHCTRQQAPTDLKSNGLRIKIILFSCKTIGASEINTGKKNVNDCRRVSCLFCWGGAVSKDILHHHDWHHASRSYDSHFHLIDVWNLVTWWQEVGNHLPLSMLEDVRHMWLTSLIPLQPVRYKVTHNWTLHQANAKSSISRNKQNQLPVNTQPKPVTTSPSS